LSIADFFGYADLSALWFASDLSPAMSRQVATDQSGDRSPHSKNGYGVVVLREKESNV